MKFYLQLRVKDGGNSFLNCFGTYLHLRYLLYIYLVSVFRSLRFIIMFNLLCLIYYVHCDRCTKNVSCWKCQKMVQITEKLRATKCLARRSAPCSDCAGRVVDLALVASLYWIQFTPEDLLHFGRISRFDIFNCFDSCDQFWQIWAVF